LTLAAVAPLALVAALGSTAVNVTVYDASRQAYAVAAGLILVLAITMPEPRGVVGRVAAWFGLISYGIYLWQAVLAQIILRHGVQGIVPMAHTDFIPYVVHCAFLLVITVPVAALSWMVLEQPCLRWAKARTRTGPRPAAVELSEVAAPVAAPAAI
jgi:peptidoglycan/LPS O-acetylase OafA/YrhL